MKRIMWLCNTPLPEVQSDLEITGCGEGWLQGISNELRKREDIELHYVFPQGKNKRLFRKRVDNIFFWGFYNILKNGYEISRKRESLIRRIVEEIHPDIIHIFGTEFAHSLECIRGVQNRRKVIVSIQGLISELAIVYTKKIPFAEQIFSIEGSGSLLKEKYKFYRRGINERELLKKAPNVIGRTAWDKQCVKKINPNCKYFYCSETLRRAFYKGRWDIHKVRRYSIFVSQIYYPIKGFHIFLGAMCEVVKSFPDVYAYVAGRKAFLQNGDAYGRYINKLIDKYGIRDRIEFLGMIDAEEVKERLLNVHISVMPSLLENSPNSIGEAICLGTPVVAARVGGIPSLVRDEKEALLYSKHNAKQMADCIKRIFSNDDLAQELSDNGCKRAEKLYDREKNLERLLKIYETVANE